MTCWQAIRKYTLSAHVAPEQYFIHFLTHHDWPPPSLIPECGVKTESNAPLGHAASPPGESHLRTDRAGSAPRRRRRHRAAIAAPPRHAPPPPRWRRCAARRRRHAPQAHSRSSFQTNAQPTHYLADKARANSPHSPSAPATRATPAAAAAPPRRHSTDRATTQPGLRHNRHAATATSLAASREWYKESVRVLYAST